MDACTAVDFVATDEIVRVGVDVLTKSFAGVLDRSVMESVLEREARNKRTPS